MSNFGDADFAGDDCYQIVSEPYMARPPAPQWETPGSRSKGAQSIDHKHDFGSVDAVPAMRAHTAAQPALADEYDQATADHINKQVMILRENLKKIQLHMN